MPFGFAKIYNRKRIGGDTVVHAESVACQRQCWTML